MGLFSRRAKDEDATPAPERSEPSDLEGGAGSDVVDDGRPERPEDAPIGEAERARIDAALARMSEAGWDVDDLQSIATAYDQAFGADATASPGRDDVVEVVGLAIGEHLVRHGRMDWRIVTDAFGTDLGVVARRRPVSVIPTTIVATRWINGERGWIPGVVGHLVRLGNG
jgi:hypothetical protein